MSETLNWLRCGLCERAGWHDVTHSYVCFGCMLRRCNARSGTVTTCDATTACATSFSPWRASTACTTTSPWARLTACSSRSFTNPYAPSIKFGPVLLCLRICYHLFAALSMFERKVAPDVPLFAPSSSCRKFWMASERSVIMKSIHSPTDIDSYDCFIRKQECAFDAVCILSRYNDGVCVWIMFACSVRVSPLRTCWPQGCVLRRQSTCLPA